MSKKYRFVSPLKYGLLSFLQEGEILGEDNLEVIQEVKYSCCLGILMHIQTDGSMSQSNCSVHGMNAGSRGISHPSSTAFFPRVGGRWSSLQG